MNTYSIKYSLIVSLISLSFLTQAQDKKTDTPHSKDASTLF